MNILALDLGQNCGWAMNNPKLRSSAASGVWSLKPSKFDSAGIKFVKFRRQLEVEIVIGEVEKVYYEAVRRHIGTDAAHAYGGYLAHVQSICIENGIPYEGVPVQTIKKHATGSGNATKEQMIAAAVAKYKSVNVIDDNHADALHLLDYVLKTFRT